MVNSIALLRNDFKGGNLLSTGQVLEALKISKITLYKWLLLGKITAIRHNIGERAFLEFDPREIERVKLKMKKKRERGKTILEE